MGGDATNAGIEFQAKLGGLIAGLALAEQPMSRLSPELPGTARKIWFEAEAPVDDLIVATDLGVIFIQAKTSLTLAANSQGRMAQVASQFVRQARSMPPFLSNRPLDPAFDRLVLTVSDRASLAVRTHLKEALARHATGAATALGRDRESALKAFRDHLGHAWTTAYGCSPGHDDLEALLRLCRVVEVGPLHFEARATYLADVVTRPGDAAALAEVLTQWALGCASVRTGGDIAQVRAYAGQWIALRQNLQQSSIPNVCRWLTGLAIEKLVAGGVYKPSRTIDRAGVQDQIEAFLSNASPVMAMVGDSGVGKSSVLAKFASDAASARPTLLVAGGDITAGQDGLAALIDAAIARAQAPGVTADQLAEQARADGGLLVLLDGWNEATAPVSEVRGRWLQHSLAWIARYGVRLVLTCRPEHWEVLAAAFAADQLHAPNLDAQAESPPPQGLRSSRLSASCLRLNDFTAAEAQAAVRLSAVKDTQLAAEITHPFLLGLLETLTPSADRVQMSFCRLHDHFIHERVGRALGHIGKLSWMQGSEAALGRLAARMLDEGVLVVSSSATTTDFGEYAPVLDGLVREHLLLLDERGFRFRLDQVREFLQARSLTPADLQQPFAGFPRWTPWDGRLGLSWRAWRDALALGHRARVDEQAARTRVPASVMAYALAEEIEARGTEAIEAILDQLYTTTDPQREDRASSWSRQVVLLTIRRLAIRSIDSEGLLRWFHRLAGREDRHHNSFQQEHLGAALVDALLRSDLSAQQQLGLFRYLALCEDQVNWDTARLRGAASIERLDPGRRGKLTFSSKPTRLLDLARRLADLDAAATIGAFADWLDDDLGMSRRSVRGFGFARLAVVAAVCLFAVRDRSLAQVCEAALRGRSHQAGDLLDALTLVEADETVRACLARLVTGEFDTPRWLEVLWRSCRFTTDGEIEVRVLGFALRNRCHDKVEIRVWSARIALAILTRDKRYSAPSSTSGRCWSDDFDPMLGELIGHIQSNIAAEAVAPVSEDYSVLLDLSVAESLAFVAARVDDSHLLDDQALDGLAGYLRPVPGRSEPLRVAQFPAVVGFLGACADRNADVAAAIAARILPMAAQAGLNHFELTVDQVFEAGLVGLAQKLIATNDRRILDKCAEFHWPEPGPLRHTIFDSLASAGLNDEQTEHLVHSLACSRLGGPDALTWLLHLRRSEVRTAWDRALHRYLSFYDPDEPFYQACADYWRNLAPTNRSPVTEAFHSWLARGSSVAEALKAISLTQLAQNDLAAELARRAAPT